MGGDHAPVETVKGAVQAAAEYGIEVVLVGKQDELERELAKYNTTGLSLPIVNAEQVVEMNEHPAAAVKSKRRSSIVITMNLLKDREVDAVFSAGNSGAAVAAGLFVLGRIPGIERPAISAITPTQTSRLLVLDMGANVDCKPHYLVQFAMMGSLYSEKVLGVARPRVALLSNGEEDIKGNAVTQEAFQQLQKTNLNFIGNVEGKDLPRGCADVIVTDGFVGNVVIKLGEGLSETLMDMIREELGRSWKTKAAAYFLLPAFRRLKHRMDYAEVGGAPLLGVNGTCIVAHGRSDARAIKNGLRMAKQAAEQDIVQVISQGIQSIEGDANVQPYRATNGIV
jgi:glycerol-3-phosphate acyltransferase PlsX